MSEAFEAFNSRRKQVLESLTGLKGHAEKVGASTLASRIGRELCDKLEEDRFHLVVVGEFNHGKTTFVNALLGRKALPVGVTPTTAVIHHVRYSPEPSAKIVRQDGVLETMPFDSLSRFAVGGDDGAAVKRLEVGYPAELLRDRIVLVDTPGVNDLNLQRADITYKYIPQSDAVLFVIDAGQPLKESERLFLRDKLIAQSRDKIIFVVAKADIWSDAERNEALAYIKRELTKLIEGPVVFPISAQRALEGREAESGMPELVAHLTAFLAEERGRIVLDNALGEALAAARSLSHGIDARRRAARMTKEEIERRIGRIEIDLEGQKRTVDERRSAMREEVAAIRAWVRRDLDRFVDDVVRQLPNIVEQSAVEDLRMHLPGFLEATFVTWAESESAEVARALEEMAEKTVAIMRESAHDAARRLSDDAHGDVKPPDLTVDTFGYDLGVAALFSVGMGMVFTNALLGALMAGAAPVLAYYLKGRVEMQTREKAREQAALALREAAAKVGPKLDSMITEFCDRLDKWVEQAGKEVHREMIDVLSAAKQERSTAEPDAERITGECDTLAKELDGIRESVETMRASLWAPVAHPDA
ncbi:MAG TPA: dynamin family protein [Polyangiaceae bacterium]|jgi:small GTP-binding protein|nr:dynamin family protein [Polyangiaceae bacterium]